MEATLLAGILIVLWFVRLELEDIRKLLERKEEDA